MLCASAMTVPWRRRRCQRGDFMTLPHYFRGSGYTTAGGGKVRVRGLVGYPADACHERTCDDRYSTPTPAEAARWARSRTRGATTPTCRATMHPRGRSRTSRRTTLPRGWTQTACSGAPTLVRALRCSTARWVSKCLRHRARLASGRQWFCPPRRPNNHPVLDDAGPSSAPMAADLGDDDHPDGRIAAWGVRTLQAFAQSGVGASGSKPFFLAVGVCVPDPHAAPPTPCLWPQPPRPPLAATFICMMFVKRACRGVGQAQAAFAARRAAEVLRYVPQRQQHLSPPQPQRADRVSARGLVQLW